MSDAAEIYDRFGGGAVDAKGARAKAACDELVAILGELQADACDALKSGRCDGDSLVAIIHAKQKAEEGQLELVKLQRLLKKR